MSTDTGNKLYIIIISSIKNKYNYNNINKYNYYKYKFYLEINLSNQYFARDLKKFSKKI